MHAEERIKWLENLEALLPLGTIVAVRLSPQDGSEYPNKLGPLYMGPWVVVERFTNGKTYRVRDLGTEQERQITRKQIKVLDVPAAWKAPDEKEKQKLPHCVRTELGKGVYVPQVLSTENAGREATPAPEGPSRSAKRRDGESALQEATVEAPEGGLHRDAPGTGGQQDGRYFLRQVPERRALQAERRRCQEHW